MNYNPYSTSTAAPAAAAGFSAGITILYLAIIVFLIVCVWRIFRKAGQPGWAAIIPFYNLYIALKICGRPGWWIILFFIPFVNIVMGIILAIDLAKSFGRSEVFGIFGLWLFSFIGAPILAFGGSQYVGPRGSGGASPGGGAPQPGPQPGPTPAPAPMPIAAPTPEAPSAPEPPAAPTTPAPGPAGGPSMDGISTPASTPPPPDQPQQ